MNERIKELMAQAVTFHLDPDSNAYEAQVSPEDLELFAELIVKECCQYLDNEAERLYTLSGSEADPVFQSNFEICAEKCYDNSQGLKDHFGVEE